MTYLLKLGSVCILNYLVDVRFYRTIGTGFRLNYFLYIIAYILD